VKIPKPCPCPPWRILAPLRAGCSALLFMLPALAGASAPAPASLPAAALASALSLVSQAAAVLAPAGARVLALPGTLDPRLRLAPCARVDAYLVTGVPAWGRTRVGLRCSSGPTHWRIFMPVTVQVWAPAVVATATLPVGARLSAEQLTLAVSDWAATPQPPFADLAELERRTLTRGVVAGQALSSADLQARHWFTAGQTVRVVTSGAGFAIATEGQALAAGVEGRRVRVRIGENHIAVGRAVGPGLVEVGL
jgi:flagella basal body P-ring formation protein FlgA